MKLNNLFGYQFCRRRSKSSIAGSLTSPILQHSARWQEMKAELHPAGKDCGWASEDLQDKRNNKEKYMRLQKGLKSDFYLLAKCKTFKTFCLRRRDEKKIHQLCKNIQKKYFHLHCFQLYLTIPCIWLAQWYRTLSLHKNVR